MPGTRGLLATLILSLAASHACAAPTLTGTLEAFLAEARGQLTLDEGLAVPAWADLRVGGLAAGTPLVSHRADTASCPEGLVCMQLEEAGSASVALLPTLSPRTREAALRALVAPLTGQEARVDLLVDDRPVLEDVRVPAGDFRPLVLDAGPGLTPGLHRVELRLAEGSGPLRVLALELRTATATPDAKFSGSLGRRARRLRSHTQGVDPEKIPVHEYYPLDLGRQWSYRSVLDDLSYTIRVDGTQWFAGQQLQRMRKLEADDEYELYSADGSGIRMWFRRDEVGGNFDMSDEPVPFSAGPYVKIGDRFEAIPENCQNPVSGGFIHWIIDYRRFQPVTVPAGFYPEALRMRIRYRDTRTGLVFVDMNIYLARGVGMVRRDGRFVTTNFKHVLTARQ